MTIEPGGETGEAHRSRQHMGLKKAVEQLPVVYIAPYWAHRGIYRADVDRAEEWVRQQVRPLAS